MDEFLAVACMRLQAISSLHVFQKDCVVTLYMTHHFSSRLAIMRNLPHLQEAILMTTEAWGRNAEYLLEKHEGIQTNKDLHSEGDLYNRGSSPEKIINIDLQQLCHLGRETLQCESDHSVVC